MLRPPRIALWLAAGAGLILVASVLGQAVKYGAGRGHLGGLIPLLYVDSETSIPTFYSTSLLLLSGLTLAVIARLKWRLQAADAWHWSILCIAFLYLAMDECSGIHELVEQRMRELLGHHVTGWLNTPWIIPGCIVAGIVAAIGLPFFLRLPGKTRRQVALAALLFLSGAVGVEALGGRHRELYGAANFTYSLIATLEEGLEMAGAIAFLYAWFTYLADHFGAIQLSLTADSHSLVETKPDLPVLRPQPRRPVRRTMVAVTSR